MGFRLKISANDDNMKKNKQKKQNKKNGKLVRSSFDRILRDQVIFLSNQRRAGSVVSFAKRLLPNVQFSVSIVLLFSWESRMLQRD
jgi:hypothetical protein